MTVQTSTTLAEACCSTSCCGGDAPGTQAPIAGPLAAADEAQVIENVRAHYAAAARQAAAGGDASCGCGCGEEAVALFGRDLYGDETAGAAPEGALRASLGCGNPHALLDLAPGQKVLDLGSGGGLDVLLSARRVGPDGHAYGLDMTDEMLDLARRNQAEAGVANATFLRGRMEEVPLPGATVDVVMSNCVINLSPDKGRVLAEAFRVLKPGGRFAVADVVRMKPLPPALSGPLALWSACLTGALTPEEFRAALERAGFADAEVEILRTFGAEDAGPEAEALLAGLGVAPEEARDLFGSAFVRARKVELQ